MPSSNLSWFFGLMLYLLTYLQSLDNFYSLATYDEGESSKGTIGVIWAEMRERIRKYVLLALEWLCGIVLKILF